mgnify:CR=1 FL=1
MQDNMIVLPEANFQKLSPDLQKAVVQAGRDMEDELRKKVIDDDKRILDLENPQQDKEMIAADQKRLVVDAFARYRIVDPLLHDVPDRNNAHQPAILHDRQMAETVARHRLHDELHRVALGPDDLGLSLGLPVGTRVRIDSAEATKAEDGSRIFAVHAIDGDPSGYMRSSTLVPRDSAAPRLWEVTDGVGTFSPNGDSAQDTFPLSLRLSEAASWTLKIVDGDGNAKKSAAGTGSEPALYS